MVSFEADDFITDKDSTIWIAKLSDGRLVYEDDDRPGYEERSAWKRLKTFCELNKLYVKQMFIKFRSHTEVCPEGHNGYFFRKGVIASFRERRITLHRYLTGPVTGGIINVQVWQVPEIILETTESRDIDGCEDAIIWNPSQLSAEKHASQHTI